MRVFTLLFSLWTAVAADDSFITQYEYGQMLYRNPRGIGCHHCHGKEGQGTVIAVYEEGGKKVVLRGPDIRKVTPTELKSALEKRYLIMPTYFLTDGEIQALYAYITQKK